MLGQFPRDQATGLYVNRMGWPLKDTHLERKWRLITDLSYPKGTSVNGAIRSELCSLMYTSVELVAGATQSLGVGALLAKLNMSAYRLIPGYLTVIYWQSSGEDSATWMGPFDLASGTPQTHL